MSDVLCDISAFKYHRVPPQVLMQLPMVPTPELDPNRSQLLETPLVSEVLGAPVHLLSERAGHSRGGKRVVWHAWTAGRPVDAIWETPFGLETASPLFSLLTMASSCPAVQLAMAMYELCGTFAVFEPSEKIEELLRHERVDCLFGTGFGWRRMGPRPERPGNLWERPPLFDLGELHDYCKRIEGMHGAKNFTSAAQMVTGVTASPFEAQASMLLGLPRRLGGEGLPIENNVPLDLNRAARRLSGTGKRVGDIVIASDDGTRCVVVECQGRAFHGSVESKIADSDRTTALQAMGYEVILMTYSQIADPQKFDTVVELIKRKLGIRPRAKSPAQERAAERLRSELFCGWI